MGEEGAQREDQDASGRERQTSQQFRSAEDCTKSEEASPGDVISGISSKFSRRLVFVELLCVKKC